MNFIENIKAWYKRRQEEKKKKKWEKQHLDHVIRHLKTDLRWLSVNPAGSALYDRYEKILSDDWYEHPVEDISNFRQRIGWCPHQKKDN